MAEYTTRTVYGAYLQTCKQIGLPFTVAPNTTLNQKFGILQNEVPDANVYPNMRYISIGNGGHQGELGADGAFLLVPKLFRATNAALYNHLPFILRPIGNDIPPADRSKYALRRLEIYDGVTYIAYYLKRLDLTNVSVQMSLTTVENGISTSVPFTPNSSVLNPTPPEQPSSGVIVTSGLYVSAKAPISIILDQVDIGEFLNVIDIKYKDRRYAVLSELALCSAVDRVVTVRDPGAPEFNMTEAIAVQVCDFANAAALLQFNNERVEFGLDIGATEPLTKIDAASGASANARISNLI
jgi:hypothetical protein